MSRPAPPPVNAELQTRAVGLINEAKMSTDRVSILETLKQVLELALHRKGGRALLPLLVSTLTEFQVHTIAAVRVTAPGHSFAFGSLFGSPMGSG